jgi:hypothetical protein
MDQLWFGTCEDVDTYFREGREFFNETYVKKLAQVSAWFTRVPTGTWPMNSGTTQRGFRFGRGFFDPAKPWRKVRSERCTQNSCEEAPEIVRRPGTDSYTWDLLRKELETEWICVEDLMYRLVPQEEIMQFEASNAIITRLVHEEFARSSFIGASAHKWAALVDENSQYCGVSDDTMWFIDENEGVDEGGFSLQYVYVKAALADLDRIAFLGLDMLDDMLVDLGDEDDAYRLDMRENGIEALEIIIPDPRTARYIYQTAKDDLGYRGANTDFDRNLTQLKIGVNRIIGDYAFGYDNNAPRYNADSVYNATLGAFNENDPDTWPRLIRVPRYLESANEIGYSGLPNKAYRAADFGISVCYVDGMKKWMNPNNTGYGKVRMEDQNYSGDFEWRRPDWECNRRGKMGFFQAQFRLGMQVKDPLIMHSFLHRLPNGRQFTTSDCPTKTDYVAPTPITNYVCQGVTA